MLVIEASNFNSENDTNEIDRFLISIKERELSSKQELVVPIEGENGLGLLAVSYQVFDSDISSCTTNLSNSERIKALLGQHVNIICMCMNNTVVSINRRAH